MAKQGQGRSAGGGVGGATASACDARLRQVQRDMEALNRDALLAATRKRTAGGKLSKSEASILARYENYKTEIAFWDLARNCPKVVYEALSGRQTKILHDQARRYGLPLLGPTVDLSRIAEWLHQSIADGRWRIVDPESDEAMMGGENSPALERWRAHKADLAEIELMERRREIFRADAVRQGLAILAGLMRGAGERLVHKCGEAAGRIFNDMIEDFERQTERLFAGEPEAGGENHAAAASAGHKQTRRKHAT